jgi:hypothetical protein
MTLNEIKTLFNQVITGSSWWAKFKGSEFITYIVTFTAQVYFRANQLSARRLQEAFLSLALKTSSILAHAESRGYVARKRIPTKIKVYLKNNSAETVFIVEDTALFSEDNNLYYLIDAALTIEPDQIVTVEVIQGSVVYFEDTVNETKKYLTKELDTATSNTVSDVKVYIEDPDGEEKQWTESYLFRNASADSQVFVEYYNSDKQLGIRFGNGVSGQIPELGSTITLKCIVTEGFSEMAAGQPLTFEGEDLLNESLSVITGSTVVVGASQEDIETLRNNALYYTNYDNTVVFDSDYRYFTTRNLPDLSWFRVWGEKDQEKLKGGADLDFIGNVYLSAYHPDLTSEQMLQSLASIYASVNMINIEYVPVPCVEDPFTIEVTGTVLSSNNPSLVTAVIKSALIDKFSSRSSAHDGNISYNKIWKALENLNLLTGFNITVNANLDIKPSINVFRHLDVNRSVFKITY